MRRAGIASLACLLLGLQAASADQVRLKGGGVLEGQILEETAEGVTLKSASGTFQVARDRIETVVRKAYVPKPPPPAPVPVPAAVPDPVAKPAPLPDDPPQEDPLKAKVAASLAAFRAFDYSPEAEAAARDLVDQGKDAVPAILSLLDDAEPAQQKWLVDVLGLIRDPAATNALLDLVHSPRAEVRGAAARALGLLKSEKGVQALINLLNDPEAPVRQEAARALSALGDLKAVPALIALLADPDRAVGTAAHNTLLSLTEENLPRDPAAWQEWLREHPVAIKEHRTLGGKPRGNRPPAEPPASP